MKRSPYGWSYWLGAVVLVLALTGMGFGCATVFGYADAAGSAEQVVAIFVWPALIAYHVIWKQAWAEVHGDPQATSSDDD